MSDEGPYRPIDCGLHDELQLRAMRGRPVDLRYLAPDGTPRARVDRLVDVFTKAGAEYVDTASGEVIRLDRLVEVDGIAFGRDC